MEAILSWDKVEIALAKAKQLGVSRDQAETFTRMGYVPLPRQFQFHIAARSADIPGGPQRIAYGGARGPGKSHGSICQLADDCNRRDGLKTLFLRKVQKNAKESFEDLIRKAFSYLPHEYIPSRNAVQFPNLSRILFGGFRTENEIDGYIGIEYDVIVIEEANQLTSTKHELIRGSLRTSRNDWRPRIYMTFNPGGVGHTYIRQNFLMPFRESRQTETQTAWIFATYKDNPYLNPEYITWLEGLPGALGRAWRDGDMDSFEGQAFMDFREDTHVVDPFEIPAHWTRYRGIDWGSASPMCTLWGARDPDTGRWVVYRELYNNPQVGDARLTDRQQAVKINEMTPDSERINCTYADPSIWEKKELEDSDMSTARVYMKNGITPLEKANNDRKGGKRRIDRLIANLPDGKPGLLVFRNCANLRRTLPLLSFDETDVEDVDTDLEDHAYDALRYLTTPAKEPPSPDKQNKANRGNPWLKMRSL